MKLIKFLVVVTIILMLSSCDNQGVTKISLKSNIDSVSYALGLDISNKFKTNFNDVDKDLFIQGFKNGIDSSNMLIEEKDIEKILRTFFQKKQDEDRKKKQEEALKKAEAKYGKIKEEGIKFLEENKSKKGVQVTKSGLQYIILKKGTGKQPKITSRVTVHYHGTTPEGEVFDSSVEKGKPIDFVLNRVIKGWTEGLQLMKEGAKYKFFIPQELAYGMNAPKSGTGPIKPFMPLVFEVELIKVKDTK